MAHAHHSMDNDMGGMDMPGMDMPAMTMYFYWSKKVNFLFESYEVTTNAAFFGACMIAFFFGFITETLSIVQDRLDQTINSKIREE